VCLHQSIRSAYIKHDFHIHPDMIYLVKLLVSFLMQGKTEEYEVSKKVMPSLPPWFHPTQLGFRSGSISQYRSEKGGHVREYAEKFVYHKDKFNPEKQPIEHIIYDTQIVQSLLALGMISFAFGRCYQSIRKSSSHR
jgi:hypothetical protein